MRRTIEKIKERKAITLIALVVTIVVLLILAGVTISLLLDENGIIAKSKYARLENRAAQVEDEFGMWKQNNFINKESNQAQEEADTILESLISRNLLKEDEIDREQEIITIKKNDGSILKQISYSQVTINISKYPETTKSGAVILTVDSVEGMTIPNFYIYNGDWTEVEDYLRTINKEQKKEMIREMLPKSANKEFETDECDTLEKALNKFALEIEGYGILDTEEKLWNCLDNEDIYEDFLLELCIGPLYLKEVNETTNIIEGYTVINPDEETSNTYVATENGTYTFKVQDIITGKTYTKKVEVTNIGENDKYYVANVNKFFATNIIVKLASAGEIKLADINYLNIGLKDKETDNAQTFTKVYIVYNEKTIDISSMIEKARYCYISGGELVYYLENKMTDFDKSTFINEEQTFIIEKDGEFYIGKAKISGS